MQNQVGRTHDKLLKIKLNNKAFITPIKTTQITSSTTTSTSSLCSLQNFIIPDSEDFLYVIQNIYNAYLEFHREKQEQDKPKDDGGKSKAVAALAAKGKGRK
jgi:hypothetical protein